MLVKKTKFDDDGRIVLDDKELNDEILESKFINLGGGNLVNKGCTNSKNCQSTTNFDCTNTDRCFY